MYTNPWMAEQLGRQHREDLIRVASLAAMVERRPLRVRLGALVDRAHSRWHRAPWSAPRPARRSPASRRPASRRPATPAA